MTDTTNEPLVHRIGGFHAELRKAGVPVGIDASVTFVRALDVLDPAGIDDLYWAGRATLVRREDHIPIFDREFARFLDLLPEVRPGPPSISAEVKLLGDAEGSPSAQTIGSATRIRGAVGNDDAAENLDSSTRESASSAEALRTRAFEELTPQEILEMNTLIENLAHRLPRRRSRRAERAGRGRLDAAATFRGSRRTMGEPLRTSFKKATTKERPILFVVDVSRSMEPYSRFLIRFAHVLLRAGRKVEVFSFGTRLTRLTTDLERTNPAEVIARAGRAIPDWGGGTRIGPSLGQLIDRFGRRGATLGTVVVICSDGLDRGDPEELRRHMIRMKALSYRIIWLNPLAADPAYTPLARGMAAALPHIDHFLGGHALIDLEELLNTFVGLERTA